MTTISYHCAVEKEMKYDVVLSHCAILRGIFYGSTFIWLHSSESNVFWPQFYLTMQLYLDCFVFAVLPSFTIIKRMSSECSLIPLYINKRNWLDYQVSTNSIVVHSFLVFCHSIIVFGRFILGFPCIVLVFCHCVL